LDTCSISEQQNDGTEFGPLRMYAPSGPFNGGWRPLPLDRARKPEKGRWKVWTPAHALEA